MRTSQAGMLAWLAAALLPLLSAPSLSQPLPFPEADPQLLQAARAEGRLTIYVNQDEEIANATAQAFKRATGIDARVLRLATVQLYSRVSAEFNSGIHEVDVLGTADERMFTDHKEWWEILTPQMIPTMSRLPKEAVLPTHLITSQSVNIMAFNTATLPKDKAPRTWQDVLKPEFKGKALLVDPRNSTTYISWLDYMVEKYGEEFLTRLRAQNFPIVSAGSPGVQEVAAGGASFVFPVTKSHVVPVMKKGAPLATIEPWAHSDVYATGSEIMFGIPKKSRRQNAAKLYLTWFLTAAAQKINCGGSYASLALPKDDIGPCEPYTEKYIAQRYLSAERTSHLLKLVGLN